MMKNYYEVFFRWNVKVKAPVNKEVKIGNRYKFFEIFPGVIFYDYTKYNKRDNASEYSNYYLTYSYDTHIAKMELT